MYSSYNLTSEAKAWKLRDIFYVILAYLMFQLLIKLVSFYTNGIDPDIKQALSYIFLIILIIFWQTRIRKESIINIGFLNCSSPFKVYSMSLILTFLYVILATVFISNKINFIISYHFSAVFLKMVLIFFTTTVKGITAAFLIPLGEELFFRGIFYSALKNKIGKIQGILWISLIFAFSHYFFNIGSPGVYKLITAAFIASIGLTYLFEYSKSLYPVIISHSLMNIIIISTDAISKIGER